MFFVQALLLSPQAYFFCRPEPFFVAPSASEGSPGTGVPREDKKKSAPREDIPGRRPERSEGCLAIARHDMVGGCHPEPYFLTPRAYFLSPRALFLSPRAQARGLPALACLGMFYVHCQGVTSFSFTLNGVLLFNTP